MSWTVLGALGAAGRARIDERGRIAPAGVPWSVDWLVGGADRWHEAASDAAVRQTLDGPAVVETRLRVSGGDIVERAWVVPSPAGGGAVAVVEIDNASPAPVVVGLCVQTGSDGATPVRLSVDGADVSANDQVVLRSSRAMRAAVAGPAGPGGVRAVVVTDQAGAPPAESHGDGGPTEAVALWPLPHRTKLRTAIRLVPGDGLPTPDDLPGPDAVARGWASHLDDGVAADTGDPAVDGAVRAWLHRLVLASEEDGADSSADALVAMALAEWGLTSFAVESLWSRLDAAAPESAGPLLAAAARVVALGLDQALVRRGLTAAAHSAPTLGRLNRRRRKRAVLLQPPWSSPAGGTDAWTAVWAELGLRGAARLAEADGQEEASAALDGAADRLERQVVDGGDPAALLRALVGPARPTGAMEAEHATGPGYLALAGASAPGADRRAAVTAAVAGGPVGHGDPGHDDPATAALLALLVRRTLVEETEVGLDVLPVPLAPRGQAMEAYGIPTVHGRLGFAVRWHGDRPALLWELDGTGPVPIRAPALDVAFVSTEPRGEVLLSRFG